MAFSLPNIDECFDVRTEIFHAFYVYIFFFDFFFAPEGTFVVSGAEFRGDIIAYLASRCRISFSFVHFF